ncbi:MAG: PD-(D/E)XK nuclease family protein, partial [Xanthomonadaceae bacterium]|nr:PD-(D/E)XK nuclease family protein [Xanthomonadaceae bacterium]
AAGVALAPLPQPAAPPRLAAAPAAAGAHAARTFAGAIERGWWTWSFTRLAHHDGAARAEVLPGAADDDRGDEADAERDALDRLLAGARFGSAFHAVLEEADFAAWRDRREAPPSEHALIERCLRREGLQPPPGVPLARLRERVGALAAATLNAPLPCGVRLAELAPARRSAEMEFHLRLAPTRSDALLALLQAHGHLADRAGLAHSAETLRGLLTGIIDLAFEHAGRYWIVDYKTNRLPAYDDDALAVAVRADDYDLQYLLYTLALHRWLGATLPDYDYDRHIGGAYYLFVRGLPAGGIHAHRPPRALIEAMDALFDGAAAEAA